MCPVWLQHQPGAVRKPRVPVDALPRPRLRTSAAMPTNNAASGNRKRSRRDMAGGGTRQGDSGGYRAVKQRSHRPRRPHDRNRDSEADMSGGGVTGGAGGVNCGAGSGSSRRRAPRSNSTSRGQPKKRRDDERGTAHCSRIDRLMQSGLGLGVRCPNVLYRQRMALARRAIAEGVKLQKQMKDKNLSLISVARSHSDSQSLCNVDMGMPQCPPHESNEWLER